MKKTLVTLIGVLAGFAAAPAQAAEITFDGYTNACFTTTTCTPGTVEGASTVLLNELSFANLSFGGTSVGGDLSLSLGTFSLDPRGNDDYSTGKFNLRVTFELPTGITGGSSSIFSSVLTGTTSSAPGQCDPAAAPCGSVTINFDNTPTLFTFSSGNTTGSFLFAVSDLTIQAGQTNQSLIGRITQANQTTTETNPTPTPEPGLVALLGTAVAGLGVRRYRQR